MDFIYATIDFLIFVIASMVPFLSLIKRPIDAIANRLQVEAKEIKFNDLNKLKVSVIRTIKAEKIKVVYKINSLKLLKNLYFERIINKSKKLKKTYIVITFIG